MSQEQKDKISKKMTGRWVSHETRIKLKYTAKEINSRPDVIMKKSEKTRNSWKDPSIRQKRLDGQKKKFSTPEYKANQSQAIKEVWRKRKENIKDG